MILFSLNGSLSHTDTFIHPIQLVDLLGLDTTQGGACDYEKRSIRGTDATSSSGLLTFVENRQCQRRVVEATALN